MKQNKGLSPIHPLSALILFVIAGLSFCPLQVLADEVKAPQWNITADKMTRYENPPSIIAEGNVLLEKTQEIEKKKKRDSGWDELLEEKAPVEEETEKETITQTRTLTTIKADWIVYDINFGSIKARGNLLVKVGTDLLMAEKGEVDLNRETGTFFDATIVRKENDLHLEGKIIEKTGDLTYHIEDGWVITCKLKEGETPPWSFTAKKRGDYRRRLCNTQTYHLQDKKCAGTVLPLDDDSRQANPADRVSFSGNFRVRQGRFRH